MVAEKKAQEQKGDAKKVAAKKNTKQLASNMARSFRDMKGEVKKIVWPAKRPL